MEHWWISWQMSKIKQGEILQAAARYRALQNGRTRFDRRRRNPHHSEAHPKPLFASFRSYLGQRLIDWGTLLKQQQTLHRINGAQVRRG
jgi:hypothetical protein